MPVLAWPRDAVVADIGGGTGSLLSTVLAQQPAAFGVMVDQPAVLNRATERLAHSHLIERVKLHEGTLFDVAPEADVYLLARVLHD